MFNVGNALFYPVMPQTAPQSRPLFSNDRYLATEIDAAGQYPEKRLWIAIVLQALTDYEDQLIRIKHIWETEGVAVNKQLLNYLRALRYEIRHESFSLICDNADVDQSHVVRRIKELDRQYGLAEVEFTDVQTRAVRIELRKLRRLNRV